MKRLVALAASALALTAAAWAKDFRPGDLRVCGATQCRVIKDGTTSSRFAAFLYGEGRVVPVPTPSVGSPVFQLRFKNGPAGVVLNEAAARVHGLNCGRFQRGRWYRLPKSLRDLTVGLKPKRLRASIPPSC